MSKKQKTYTAEFKAEAIKAIEENQGNVSESARQLGISIQTLSNWNNKAKAGTLAGTKQLKWNVNFYKRQQRTLPKKVSEVRLYEIAKPLISDYFNGSITSCIRFSLL